MITPKRIWKTNPQAMAAVAKRVLVEKTELSELCDGDTWLTPRYILSQLGSFDLDPCAASQNRHWICERGWVQEEDGLSRSWNGRVFMNPPFSNTAPWLVRHADHGEGVSLVPASVESRIWREKVWKHAAAVLLLHGRTRFCNPDGSATNGRPLRSIALIAWSEADAHILKISTLAGVFLADWSQR